MKIVFVVFILIFSFVQADSTQEVQSLHTHLKRMIQSEVAKECQSCEVDLQIHNQPSVDDIAIPDQVISDRWKGQTNLILKVGEEARVVTVTIRWKDNVVVAKKNIKQGKVLAKKDLRLIKKDVTYLKVAYLQKVESAEGWVGRKIFKRGQIIDEDALTKPLVVRYGQSVQIVMNKGALQLNMTGQARGAGAVGDLIPVYIPETRKKLSAIIIDKSTTRVE